MIISIIARKGGVGKTTTALNLAAGLALEGKSTLLVDLDSQGSIGLSLGLSPSELIPSMADVLLDGEPLSTAVREHPSVPGLSFATCDRRFKDGAARLALVPSAERTELLARALEEGDEYDYVIVDTAGLDLITVNALEASDASIHVMQPEKLSLDGLQQLRLELHEFRAEYGVSAELLGVLITMVDTRIVAVREAIDEVRTALGESVFLTEIPRTTRLAEAPWEGEPVFRAFPASTGTNAYQRLVREVQQRVEGLSAEDAE